MIRDMAEEVRTWFERRKRPDGKEVWNVKVNAPEVVHEVVFEASGGRNLVDEYVYQFVVEALDRIAEMSPEEIETRDFAFEIDVYGIDLVRWLAESRDAVDYCDDVILDANQGSQRISCTYDLLALGQLRHREEVAYSVLDVLEKYASKLPDGEEEW